MKFIPMGFIFSAELAAITNEIGTPHIFNWLCDFRQITHPFQASSLKASWGVYEIVLNYMQDTYSFLVFSRAALPSLHFHEKDPGSAQFLWSQLCKRIPGSTLIEGSVCPLPPPVIHRESTTPPQAGYPGRTGGSFIHTQPPFPGHLPRARPRASLWMGPLAVYLSKVDNHFG